MKPASFDYHRPDTVEDAAALLAELGDLGDGAKILAGGQSLVPMLSMRLAYFDHLIDISRLVELQGIDRRGRELWIGAGTTAAAVGADDRVRQSVPLLTRATPFVGHFQIRNRGTLGGSIAHADAAGEYPAAALALDAVMEVLSPRGRREIAAADFFVGLWETTMASDEVLTGVRFPAWNGRSGFSVHEFSRRHGDFAIAGALVAVQLDDDDRVSRCGIGLLGLGSTPRRATAAEAAVVGKPVSELVPEEIGRAAMNGLDDVPTDLQGSASYRTQVGGTMAARAWDEAVNEAMAEGVAGEQAMHEQPVQLSVNETPITASVEPRMTLADFLRDKCGLTGTHLGCEHGACGACTVLLEGDAVRSCLMFAVQADGMEVTTVEGIASPDGTLSPVQSALRECHGLQCGFCTPGFVMSLTALLRDNPNPTDDEIREGLSGNFCRCTGYQGIVAAAHRAAEIQSVTQR